MPARKGPRPAESYRAARRNAFHGNWPNTPAIVREAPPVRKNTRDRSKEVEARRKERSVVLDFTDGAAGLSRMLINHEPPLVFQKKPKRHWAAKARKRPLPKDIPLHIAQHTHPRHKRAAAVAEARAA